MNIRVYTRGERTDRPAARTVTKSTACKWVSMGLYIWLGKSGKSPIRELTAQDRRAAFTIAGKPVNYVPYIPEKMPPVDIPGVIFQEPQSPTWRMQHRGGAV